jgi:hypothetical protein
LKPWKAAAVEQRLRADGLAEDNARIIAEKAELEAENAVLSDRNRFLESGWGSMLGKIQTLEGRLFHSEKEIVAKEAQRLDAEETGDHFAKSALLGTPPEISKHDPESVRRFSRTFFELFVSVLKKVSKEAAREPYSETEVEAAKKAFKKAFGDFHRTGRDPIQFANRLASLYADDLLKKPALQELMRSSGIPDFCVAPARKEVERSLGEFFPEELRNSVIKAYQGNADLGGARTFAN